MINNESSSDGIPLYLEKMGKFGDTIARLDGEDINVFGGIVGEEVRARVYRYRRRKKRYISALVTDVLKSSPHRISAPCPYFGPCSGCQWQHIAYDYQLELKRELILEACKHSKTVEANRIASTLPSPLIFGYRNHARFTVRNRGTVGFTNKNFQTQLG